MTKLLPPISIVIKADVAHNSRPVISLGLNSNLVPHVLPDLLPDEMFAGVLVWTAHESRFIWKIDIGKKMKINWCVDRWECGVTNMATQLFEQNMYVYVCVQPELITQVPGNSISFLLSQTESYLDRKKIISDRFEIAHRRYTNIPFSPQHKAKSRTKIRKPWGRILEEIKARWILWFY